MAPFVCSDADDEGASDFEDHDIPFEEAEFVPPAPPIQMPPLQGATENRVERVHPGCRHDSHPVRQRLASGRYLTRGCGAAVWHDRGEGRLPALGPA
jgi:hypothetical protein